MFRSSRARPFLLATTLALSACSACDGPGTSTAEPRLELRGAPVTFGGVLLNTSVARTLTLRNGGTGLLGIRSVTIEPADAELSGGAQALQLSSGEDAPLVFRFLPQAVGEKTFTIVIVHDAAEEPVRVQATATGVTEALAIEPNPLENAEVGSGASVSPRPDRGTTLGCRYGKTSRWPHLWHEVPFGVRGG